MSIQQLTAAPWPVCNPYARKPGPACHSNSLQPMSDEPSQQIDRMSKDATSKKNPQTEYAVEKIVGQEGRWRGLRYIVRW